MKEDVVGSNQVKVLDFRIETSRGTEVYGINVSKVVEIVHSVGKIASVPGAPPAQLGIVSLRERTYPVFDMGAFLGLAQARKTDPETDPLVITEFSNLRLGFYVHEVSRIRSISWTDLQPVSETNAGKSSDRKVVGTVILPPEDGKSSEIMLVLDLEGMATSLGFFEAQEVEANEEDPDPRLHGKKILLAEDSPSAKAIILRTLLRAGAHVDAVDNGEAARKRVEAAPGHYDLVLSDVEMPIMDGYALAKSLSSLSGAPPVILHSSMSGTSNVKKGLASGAVSYLVKMDPRKLVDELGAFFETKKRSAP